MSNSDHKCINSFIYPRVPYLDSSKTEDLAFHANLQEFSQRVSYVCGLESGGKLSPEQAYEKVECLWQHLKQSKQRNLYLK
ncbi:MAG: hypothetical protein F6J89_17625 [Symploca sp. SIO1C4]|uniref:Isopropylmalate/homocitrate/citramalate synthase n=1 Tax=Symploca sp. SIO1C4 TaxID=2607765 RepID=A0A6B3N8E0_9CYAN|nr:hypothetical protein [Symploca sp. SIO1C4]